MSLFCTEKLVDISRNKLMIRNLSKGSALPSPLNLKNINIKVKENVYALFDSN